MIRAPRVLGLLLGLATTLLSGCFSSNLVNEIDRRDESRITRVPSLELTPASLPVQIAGERVCRQQPVYLLEASSRPLYLDFANARLSEQRPDECDSVWRSERLHLVVSDTRIPFRPSDSANLRTALLVLDLREPGRGETHRRWHVGWNSRLVYTDDSTVRDQRMDMDIHLLEVRPPLASDQKGYTWLFLTIPLDVITSPIQVVVLAVGGATMLVLGAMLGGHPW